MPDYDLDEVLELTTEEQVAAVGNLARFRILEVLSTRAATVSQLAVELGLLKGSVSHHLKVLASAGLVRTVRTAKVRGGTERYWGRVARTFGVAPSNPAHGRRGLVLRAVAEDLDAAARCCAETAGHPPAPQQPGLPAAQRADCRPGRRCRSRTGPWRAGGQSDHCALPHRPTCPVHVALRHPGTSADCASCRAR